jgi:hypothetical protein
MNKSEGDVAIIIGNIECYIARIIPQAVGSSLLPQATPCWKY